MLFGLFTLAVALIISAVAAYYSIIGLTAIFAAAFWPIVIMGTALEVGKIVAVTWLHNYWGQAGWRIKAYLLPAVVALMVITSMGIFGFLSKAHSDQTIVSGDAGARVALFDEKIQTQRENIDTARAAIQQMNRQVDELLSRGTTEQNAQRAAQLRRQQSAERNRLQRDIAQAQAEIQKLQEERAPLAASLRKIEAEVGPIKYIAAIIYGDNPDTNLLERAVRWMIILIVLVFDPLAITLILAANKNFEWHRAAQKKQDESSAVSPAEPTKEHQDLVEHVQRLETQLIDTNQKLKTMTYNYGEAVDEMVYWRDQYNKQRQQTADRVDSVVEPPPETEIAPNAAALDTYDDSVPPIWEKLIEIGQNYPESPEASIAKKPRTPRTKKVVPAAKVEEPIVPSINPVVEKKDSEIDNEIVTKSIPETNELPGEPTVMPSLESKSATETAKEHLNLVPAAIERTEVRTSKSRPLTKEELAALLSPVVNTVNEPTATFGTSYPKTPKVGDTVLRVDSLPHRLFKWNGNNWIEIDKNVSTTYAYDVEYIKYLINKIDTGEYDVDDLNDAEQEQIKKYLKENNGNRS